MRVVALSGGVGGARLCDGLAAVLPADELTIVVNTGDDFVHWGLTICPDLDTMMYTLAGLAHPEQGWGVAGETFHALAMVERYGGPAWFRLGDRDLGTHLIRAQGLAAGRSLTAVTDELRRALGIGARLLPMSDAPRPTLIDTPDGTLSFQDWLVGQRGAPRVERVRFTGPPRPADGVVAAIDAADVVILPPSNPYVSIDPILALDGVRAAVARRPVIAVSPIVAGKAIKGPLAPMIESLAGRPPSTAAIAAHYGDLLDVLVHERGDDAPAGVATLATATVMGDRADRARLAREILDLARRLP